MNPEKKQLLRNLLILILAAVLVFAGYKFYQKKKVAPPETKVVSQKLKIPEASTELRILRVLEIKIINNSNSIEPTFKIRNNFLLIFFDIIVPV